MRQKIPMNLLQICSYDFILVHNIQCSKLAVVRWPAASDFLVWPVEISKPQVRLACGIFFIKN